MDYEVCYLHFAPENPEDGEMYLLVPAHPDCPRQNPESHKMVGLCVCVCMCVCHIWGYIVSNGLLLALCHYLSVNFCCLLK